MRSFRHVLIIAFGVSLSGLAAARTPPSLVKEQQASANASRTSNGYRDINQRFGSVPTLAPRVTRDASAYRDINYRFGLAAPRSLETASQGAAGRVR